VRTEKTEGAPVLSLVFLRPLACQPSGPKILLISKNNNNNKNLLKSSGKINYKNQKKSGHMPVIQG
jgi:hypothetical protein